jgi:BRCA1 C Terminus (BRCT) domain
MKATSVKGEGNRNLQLAKLSYATRFTELSTTIRDNGGKVVDFNEPKLTHIIIDKRDDSRRLELMKRTAKSVCFPSY